MYIGTITKTYHFVSSETGESHTAQLRHNTYSGYRYLLIDAKEQKGTEVCLFDSFSIVGFVL
jgi:hypothetical protein